MKIYDESNTIRETKRCLILMEQTLEDKLRKEMKNKTRDGYFFSVKLLDFMKIPESPEFWELIDNRETVKAIVWLKQNMFYGKNGDFPLDALREMVDYLRNDGTST